MLEIYNEKIQDLMEKTGFGNITSQSMSFGSVAIISGEKI